MKFKHIVPAALAAVALLTLAGCSATGSSATQSSSAQSATLKLGYIGNNDATAYALEVTQSMKAAAKKAGVDLITCDAGGDAAKALQCAINLKQDKVQGYLNYQSNVQAAAQICAQGPSVPVIAISIDQEPCQVSYMGANNLSAGTIAGKQLGAYFKSKFDCKYDAFVWLGVPQTGSLNADRLKGYENGFKSECGTIHDFRTISTDATPATALTQMTETLSALPTAKRIIVAAVSDGPIEGTLAAAAATNRLADIYASGQGLDPSGVCGMRKYPKQWVGDTAYFPDKYGSVGIPALIKLVEHKKIPKVLYTKLGWVTPTTVDKAYPSITCNN